MIDLLQMQVILADFGYTDHALWFTCSQTLTNYSKLFGFPNHMTLSVNDGHSKKLGGYKLDIRLCIIMDKN